MGLKRAAAATLEHMRRERPADRMREGAMALQILSMERWIDSVETTSDACVTVITATRDRLELLRDAAASVLGQQLEDWEWIVVNDGSPDACSELIEALDDDRVSLVEAGGIGLPAARNLGLERAQGSVVCYLDDDNLLHRGWLRAITYAMGQSPDLVWGFGARIVQTPEVSTLSGLEDFPYLEFPAFSSSRLRRGNYIDANTIFHTPGTWRFDENTNSQSDWELLLRLSAACDPVRVPAISCLYRTMHEGRMSRSDDRRIDREYIRTKHALRRTRR